MNPKFIYISLALVVALIILVLLTGCATTGGTKIEPGSTVTVSAISGAYEPLTKLGAVTGTILEIVPPGGGKAPVE